MALGPLVMLLDNNGNNIYALPAPGYVLSRALTGGGAAESITVPAGARFAVFSATGDFFANYTTTATVPTDVTDGTASELNPSVRNITGVSTISIISPSGTPTVTVAFYS